MDVYFILTITFSFSFIIVGYEDHARMKGWTTGGAMVSGGTIHITSGLISLSVLIQSFYMLNWWSPFVILVGGFVTGFMLSNIFKSYIQIIASIGMLLGWVLCISLL